MATDKPCTNNNYNGHIDLDCVDSEVGLTTGYPVSEKENNRNNNNGGQEGRQCRISPVLETALTSTAATLTFLGAINFPFMPVLPWPLTGCLLPAPVSPRWPGVVIVLLVMWGIHFSRRFGEALFLHRYQRQGSNCHTVFAFLAHFSLIGGLWNGWSLNLHIENGFYTAPNSVLVVMGVLTFIVGEITNFFAHWKLRGLRPDNHDHDDSISRLRVESESGSDHTAEEGFHSGDETRVMAGTNRVLPPEQGMFKFVDCPHYAAEILTWVGFAAASMTLAAWTFALVSSIILIISAYRTHLQYKKYFDGKEHRTLYPVDRKAIIPFVL